LNIFYSLANIVFIGGSLVPHGGQNPIEAAYLGKKIYHGKNIQNFIDVYDVLNQLKFTQQVENERQLEHYVKEALANPKSINKDININRLKKEGDDTVSKVLEVIYQYL
jgi:3-deoxy-D-manno-octulosonic-acid transferase